MQFSMPDQWSRHLFLALCRRYGLSPYRLHRQRRNIAQLDLNHAALVHHRRCRRVPGHHHRYECRAASHVAPGIFRGFRRLPPPKKQKTGADVMTPGDLLDTLQPGSKLSATRRPFVSASHRRRRPVPVITSMRRSVSPPPLWTDICLSLSSSLRLPVAIQASRKMTSRSHHPGSAAEMAGGAAMTLTVQMRL
jgi:hypothetical protein